MASGGRVFEIEGIVKPVEGSKQGSARGIKMTKRIHVFHLAQEQRIAERTQQLAERKRSEEALRQSETSLREAQHEREVAVVLMDLGMPVMDGPTLLRNLRASHPDLPVIVMSGTLDSAMEPPSAGITATLTKPFRLEQMLTVIAEALHFEPRGHG